MDQLNRSSISSRPASKVELAEQVTLLMERLEAMDAEHARETAVLKRTIRLLEDKIRQLRRGQRAPS